MGFSIGSIVSEITSVVTDPGKLVSQIADSILPSRMKALGDMLGGIVDLDTGHSLQALSHLSDTLKDLPQLLQEQAGAQVKSPGTPAGTAGAEPSPPPPRASQTVASANATPPPANAAPTTGAAPPANPAPAAGAAPPANPAPAAGAAPPANPAPPATAQPEVTLSVNLGGGRTLTISENLPPGSSGKTAVARSVRQVVGRAHHGRVAGLPWAAAPRTPRQATSPSITLTTSNATASAPANPAPTTGSTASAGASTSATSASATLATSATSTSTPAAASATSTPAASATSTPAAASATSAAANTGAPSSLASLLALSPDQFLQAVTSGNIPPDVANNPSAMAQIQARMNQITQMNQLLTSMMAAMHQMQMSIIQNIRC